MLKVEELSRRKLTEDFEAATSFFQGSNVKTVYNLGDNDEKHPNAEIHDRAHQEFAGFTTVPSGSEKQVRGSCKFITCKRESLFQGAQSILASTVKPVTGCHKKRKSNQELDNCQITIVLGKTREQLLAEAKSEILRHEYRADLAENNVCELKRQIDSQAVEIGHSRPRYKQSRREQAPLHEELADRERALRDTRIGRIQKLKN